MIASGTCSLEVLVPGARTAAGPAAALVLVDGATPLRREPALFEAMLEGWRRQQAARRLTVPLIEGRARLVAVAVDARAGRGLDHYGWVGAFDGPFL